MSGSKSEGEPESDTHARHGVSVDYVFYAGDQLQGGLAGFELCKLPVVGSARPVETEGEESLLILNVNKEGQLNGLFVAARHCSHTSKPKPKWRVFDSAKRKNSKVQGDGRSSRTTVVVRADRETPFGLLNLVIKTLPGQWLSKVCAEGHDSDKAGQSAE